MSERFLRLYEKENIDAIMSSLFNADKISKNRIINTNRTGDIINSIIDTNIQRPKLLSIKMRKLAVYQSVINKKAEEDLLPINMRKRLLYERNINN